jgi:hypothetical protein
MIEPEQQGKLTSLPRKKLNSGGYFTRLLSRFNASKSAISRKRFQTGEKRMRFVAS